MATKLKRGRDAVDGLAAVKGTEVTRETAEGLLVTLGVDGLYIKEKGRRLVVGPFDYAVLYRDGVQRASGFSPVKPREPGRGKVQHVSRGLLGVSRGK
jgi:hypothetical protein